tara:strand:- start:2333 stop:2791 length:459 start_codon:yes stop_codon:yes gene_type:complete
MASAKQRAWRKKFAAMAKSGKFRKKSTRKGGARKYIRKAYEKSKQKVKRNSSKSKSKSNKPRKKSNSILKLPKLGGTAKKIAIGLGAAQLAGMAAALFVPQFAGIAKPAAALIAGGIPGIAAELVLDQGILGNITGMFNGGGINETRLASGL